MTIIEKAIMFAARAHEGTTRKGKPRPYILHPVEVMTIVAGLTEDEEVISAAVLHDTVEDTDLTHRDIRHSFGERVEQLVMAESEDKMTNLPPEASWELRKQATIDHLETLGRDAKLICLGDKLANLREISRDYAAIGDKLWERFNQKDKAKHAWYYSSICDVLELEFGEINEIKEYRALLKRVFGRSRSGGGRKIVPFITAGDGIIFRTEEKGKPSAYIWVADGKNGSAEGIRVTGIYSVRRIFTHTTEAETSRGHIDECFVKDMLERIKNCPKEDMKKMYDEFDREIEWRRKDTKDWKEYLEWERVAVAAVKKADASNGKVIF